MIHGIEESLATSADHSLAQSQRTLILDVVILHRAESVPQDEAPCNGDADPNADHKKPSVSREPDRRGRNDCSGNDQCRRASYGNRHTRFDGHSSGAVASAQKTYACQLYLAEGTEVTSLSPRVSLQVQPANTQADGFL